MKQEKTPRFFGHPLIFGNGDNWAYIGDTPEDIKYAFKIAFSCEKNEDINWNEVDDTEIIKVVMMTDAEVNKLPEL